MAEVITRLLDPLLVDLPFTGTIYADFNGENWRSNEYAFARSKMKHTLIGDTPVSVIAESLGEIGCVNFAVNLALVSFISSPKSSILISSTDVGDVGALLLSGGTIG